MVVKMWEVAQVVKQEQVKLMGVDRRVEVVTQ